MVKPQAPQHVAYFSKRDSKNFKTFEDIDLADPQAIEKIGRAILKLHKGDLSPYYRKNKKKA